MPFFSNQNKPRPNGKKAQNVMANLLAYSVVACYGILGLFVFGALLVPGAIPLAELYEQIFMILVMTIGAFLALAKDIFSPRREITIEQVMELAKYMAGNNQSEIEPEPEPKQIEVAQT